MALSLASWVSPVPSQNQRSTTPAPAERDTSLLKTTFKALRRVSLCPWRIGAITAAALVLLHHEHRRTT
jgi:hypothetical protein